MKNKTIKRTLMMLSVCIPLVIIIYFIGVYVFKINNFILLELVKSQKVYILGTTHSEHFNRFSRYSLANVQSVINTINPDLILIETRQETVNNYNVLDGPIDMIYSWTYAVENGIEVKGIDWWIPGNYNPGGTNELRDDKIYENIISELKEYKNVLVICGFSHKNEQRDRLKNIGFIEIKIPNKSCYLNSISENEFYYPRTMANEIEKKINFLNIEMVKEIKQNVTDNKYLELWLNQMERLKNTLQIQLNEIIKPNKLYK